MSADVGAHRAPEPPTRADTAHDPAGPNPAGPEPAAPDLAADSGGGPGSTRIADRVVERIARRTVDGLDRASGSSRHVLGVKVGSLKEDTPARVDATVDGDVATVVVSMAVRWPASVRQVTRQARDQISRDVVRWTGLRVAHVDISVPELLSTSGGGR